jgi:hypothetical protein
MARTKGTAYKVRYPHTHAWKPSILPESGVSDDYSLTRTKLLFEVKVRARTRRQQKKQDRRSFYDRLVHGLPVEIVVQVGPNVAR